MERAASKKGDSTLSPFRADVSRKCKSMDKTRGRDADQVLIGVAMVVARTVLCSPTTSLGPLDFSFLLPITLTTHEYGYQLWAG